jgi:Ctr copper transporter family
MDATDDSTASMSMTFDGWNVYKLKLLFDGWDVATPWEFGLTCVAVAFLAVIYQAMRFLVFVVEDTMHPPASPSFSTVDSMDTSSRSVGGANKVGDTPGGQAGYQRAPDDTVLLAPKSPGEISSERYLWLRLAHSVLAGLNYGMALVLMLIAMSYNPSIFVSLITGYAFGDFIFFVRMRSSSNESCH